MDLKLKNHLVNLYFLALSDGNFAPEEMNVILEIANEKGISKEEFESIITNPMMEITFPENFVEKVKLLYDFVRVVLADGIIEADEKQSFLKFCERFQIEQDAGEELFEWLVELAKQNLPSTKINEEIEKLIQ
ncbi:MAG: hypothetical protein ACTTJM_03650 [Bergeyella cardium]